MTQTPQQERPEQEAPGDSGLDTKNLRDYTALRRSTQDRKIAGVAGGLARHLNIDPLVIRVTFVILIFFGAAGLVLYGAAWLLVPEDNGKRATVHLRDSSRQVALILVGVLGILLVVGDTWGDVGFPWPLTIAALIVFAVLLGRDNRRARRSADPTQPADGPTAALGYALSPPARRGPVLFGITLALIAVAWGALGIYDAGAGHHVVDAAYPAIAVALVGALLVLGAFYGRPGGLVLLGLVASVALAGTAIGDPRYDGDRSVDARPTSASQVADGYHIPAGSITLDLRGVADPQQLSGRTITLDANAAEIVVILPQGLGALVDADVHVVGAIDVPGHTEEGFGPTLVGSVGSTSSDDPHVTLNIDLRVGHIDVRQDS